MLVVTVSSFKRSISIVCDLNMIIYIWITVSYSKLFVILGTKGLVTVGEMYFDKDKMKINMDNVGRVGKDGSKKLLGYV